MLKKNQKIHNVNKGNLKNKRKQRKKRKQNETKIEIEIIKNQINNTNYDIQSYNDNEITNRKRFVRKNTRRVTESKKRHKIDWMN